MKEKCYADAFEELLKKENIDYQREVYYPITMNGQNIGKNYLDFMVNDQIIIELKTGNFKYYGAYQQLLNYLKLSNLKLGLIIRFTMDGVKTKRIINIQ